MSGHTHRQAIAAAGTGRGAALAACWLASHATAQPEGTIR
jgi:hypothetical protein